MQHLLLGWSHSQRLSCLGLWLVFDPPKLLSIDSHYGAAVTPTWQARAQLRCCTNACWALRWPDGEADRQGWLLPSQMPQF